MSGVRTGNRLARARLLQGTAAVVRGEPIPQDECPHHFRVRCPDCDKTFDVDQLLARTVGPSQPSRVSKTGDKLWVRYGGHTLEASVLFASHNRMSLILEFDAILGGHVGMMPVLQDDEGVFRSIVTHEPVELLGPNGERAWVRRE
jgi:hypothetical protein